MRLGLFGALFAATAVTCAAAAAVAEEPPAASSEPYVAKVVVAGADGEAEIVRASVVEQLDRLGVRAESERAVAVRPEDVVAAKGSAPNLVARAWIDVSAPSETVLYVVDGSGARILVRRFPRAGCGEIAREAALLALQTAVDALLHGGLIGVSRDEAREALGLPASSGSAANPARVPPAKEPRVRRAAPPPPAPPPEEGVALGLGLSYEIGAYAKGTIEHGPIVALSVTRPFQGRVFGLVLTGQYRSPIHAAEPPVTLRLESGAFRMSAMAELVRPSPLSVRVLAGGGFDLVRADPDLAPIVDAVLRPISRVDAVVRAGVALSAPLFFVPRSSFELALAVDVAPSVRPYVLTRAGEQTVLLAPWTVRPLVTVGLAVP